MGKQDKINPNDKPVGYGSSIQSSGNGNKNRPQKPIDKNQLAELNKNIHKTLKKEK